MAVGLEQQLLLRLRGALHSAASQAPLPRLRPHLLRALYTEDAAGHCGGERGVSRSGGYFSCSSHRLSRAAPVRACNFCYKLRKSGQGAAAWQRGTTHPAASQAEDERVEENAEARHASAA